MVGCASQGVGGMATTQVEKVLPVAFLAVIAPAQHGSCDGHWVVVPVPRGVGVVCGVYCAHQFACTLPSHTLPNEPLKIFPRRVRGSRLPIHHIA